MKIKLVWCFLLVSSTLLFSQNSIIGKWRINHLIGYEARSEEYIAHNEYQLYLQDKRQNFSYGNNVVFNADGKFASGYSAPCGNDCFPLTAGKFKFIDDNHVSFYLDSIFVFGDCKHLKLFPKKELGIYYVSKQDNVIKLIKSNGNLSDDLNNVTYSKIIDDFDKDTHNAYNLINLKWDTVEPLTSDEEALTYALKTYKDYTKGNQKMLYSKSIRNNLFYVFLIEYDGKKGLLIKDRLNITLIDL